MTADGSEAQLVGLLVAVSDRWEEMSPAAHLSVMEALNLYDGRAGAEAPSAVSCESISNVLTRAVSVSGVLISRAPVLAEALRHAEAKALLEDALIGR